MLVLLLALFISGWLGRTYYGQISFRPCSLCMNSSSLIKPTGDTGKGLHLQVLLVFKYIVALEIIGS
jgi:hypothetical protein